MSSIAGATFSPTVWNRSKTLALPDDFDPSEPADSAYAKWRQAELAGTPLMPVNRPDNIWGKIALPDGQVVTIYNGGSVESENVLDVDLPMHADSEVERAQAILARHGGALEVTASANSTLPKVKSDVATLWSNVMDSPILAERLLNIPEYQILPNELMSSLD